MDISVYGHFNIDVLIRVDNMPKNPGSIPASDVRIRPGGTGRNISKILGKLKIDNELISFVGGEFPREFIDDLSKFSKTDKVRIKNDYGYSPSCFIISDGRDQMAIIDQGPMKNPDEIIMPVGKLVHFSTGNPDYYIKIKHEIGKKKLISFDPGQEILYRYDKTKFINMISETDFSFFNEREYSAALKFLSENEMKRASKNIIVTLGERGCMIISDVKKRLEAYRTVERETVGAGDSFRAGFYYGYFNNYSIEDSCRIGMKVASVIIRNGNIDSEIDMNEITEIL